MNIFLKIVLGIVIFFVVVIGLGMIFITRGLKEGKDVVINDINLAEIKDGVYTGKYNFERWSNEVEVTVKNNKITNINVVKDVTFSKEEVKKGVIDKVIEKQSLKIDIVSGATVTEKSYLKSIENALS